MPNQNQLSITFICGCLEPGKDGVGDYTRRIGTALIAQGHNITLLALNDRLINTITTAPQIFENTKIPCLRLPASLPTKKNTEAAKKWISKQDPQWLSLQFVPFSFQKKGVPFALSKQLIELGQGRNWHIMFHELRLGLEKQASLKYRLWGSLQAKLVRRMLIKLNPKCIHTHSVVYANCLSQLTERSIHRLSLFGNIPNITEDQSSPHQDKLIFLLFGWIHQNAPLTEFVEEISEYRRTYKKDIILQLIGKSDTEKQHWISAFKHAGLKVEDLGEQPPESISETLTKATFGLTTTPFALVEKSGTVAAMIEHNLPVICVAGSWAPRGLDTYVIEIPVQEYQPGRLEYILQKENNYEEQTNVETAAKKMIADLLANS